MGIANRSILVFSILQVLPASGREAEPLAVRATVAPGVHYVGEAIEVRVGVVAEGVRPEIVPPKVAEAELALIGASLRPIGVSGIGDVVQERNQFLSRFQLVPHRAGVLEVPPFRARWKERAGASVPFRLSIEAPTVVGRPAEFLGGVGPFEISAEASPTTLRTGQELEFRLRLTGPGALGATRPPNLERFDRLPIGLRIDALPPETVMEPPARVFRYRLRPTRAGASVLPPVTVAAFDPKTRQYVTKVTAGIPIQVVAAPRFDPATLDYGSRPNLNSPPVVERGSLLLFFAGTGLLVAILAIAWMRTRTDRRDQAGPLARRLAGSFQDGRDPEETARAIADGLIEYLALTIAWPRGALTPIEARRGFHQATGSTNLAADAERLVAQCDRVRFAHEDAEAGDLVGAASLFLGELAQVRVRKQDGS